MHQELRRLVDDYASAVDRRELDRAAELFVPDGLLVLPDVPRVLEPCIEHRGRAAIRAALEGVTACVHTMHAIVGHVADTVGDVQMGQTACLAHHLVSGRSGLEDWVWTMWYDDEYAFDGDRWRFLRRSARVGWIEVRDVRYLRDPDGGGSRADRS